MPDDILSTYRSAACEHGICTATGDAEGANRAYDTLHSCLAEISKSGRDDLLLELYEDADEWVELWAAVHTLESNEDRAHEKLGQIAESCTLPGARLDARYTLREWEAGNLRFRTSDASDGS